MLMKRLLFSTLLLTVLVIFTGCSTTGKTKEEIFLTKYRNAGDECIRWGYVRETDGYHRCIYTLLGLKKYLIYPDEEEVDDDLEVVCTLRSFTGSRVKRRVCSVEREWAKADKKNEERVDEFEREFNKSFRTYIPPIQNSVGLSAQMGAEGTTQSGGPW